jgi:hypothetical protein
MILLNQLSAENKPITIAHICNPERVGNAMTKAELHKFGIPMLTAFLDGQDGNIIEVCMDISNNYPHIVLLNPNKVLLHVWVKTVLFPA